MPLDLIQTVNDKLKRYSQMFVLNPSQWRKFSTKATLQWKRVKFTPQNKSFIPKSRGIYAFVAQRDDTQLPHHGYVMYVGISGDHGKHTLNDRYGDYLRDKKINKRATIHYMLNNWSSGLFFHYAIVSDQRIRLEKLEEEMSDALIPPFSTNDFSADIRQAKKAF